jgi:hypothetical protein
MSISFHIAKGNKKMIDFITQLLRRYSLQQRMYAIIYLYYFLIMAGKYAVA